MPTFDTPEPISVTIELGVGDIQITTSDRTDTIVEVRPSDPAKRTDVSAAEETRVEFANGRLLITGPKGWRQWKPRGGDGSIDVRIELPTGSRVSSDAGVATLRSSGRLGDCRCKTGVGDFRLDGAGSVELKTGAGDITVEHVADEAEINTGSGAVEVAGIDGVAVVRNGNGDTWIGEVAGEARLKAANGDISIDRAHAGVAAKTANGHVRLGEVEHGAVVAQSAFGAIEVGVRDGVAAWLDLDTKWGSVRNDLDPEDRPDPGEDAVEVHARTSMGDITIHRSHAARAGKDEA